MENLETQGWNDYQLIDSGDRMKLERFGPYMFARPSPNAFWNLGSSGSTWKNAVATYHRSSTGGGDWQFHQTIPESWTIQWKDIQWIVKPTGFGHMGIFPEQEPCWQWIREIIGDAVARNQPVKVLNLFAYTGFSTAVAAKAGGEVCHVDGSKGAVTWANDNMTLNGLNHLPVRWIVDDVLKFIRREERRGRQYHGIILDPPSFGRGPKGQVWKIDQHLAELFQIIRNILSENPLFILMTSHSPNVSPEGIRNLMKQSTKDLMGTVESGELLIAPENSDCRLPAGVFGRWLAR